MLASVALVVVPGLLALRRNARTALPVAIFLPAAASVLALSAAGLWLAPMVALAALDQERGRALAVLGAIDQAVLELDGDGTVRFASPAAEHLPGVPPQGLWRVGDKPEKSARRSPLHGWHVGASVASGELPG